MIIEEEKCPRCGTRWSGISVFCPVCNYEFYQAKSVPAEECSPPFAQPRESQPQRFPNPTRTQPVIDHKNRRGNPAPVFSPKKFLLPDLLRKLLGRARLIGIVINVSNTTAYPERSILKPLLTICIIGLLILNAGDVMLAMVVPIIMIVCMLKMVNEFSISSKQGPSFFSTLFINYISAVINFNVTKAREKLPVLNIRLKIGENVFRDIRIHGELISGNVHVGDKIEVEGFCRNGTLIFQSGRNLKTNADIIIKRR